MKENNILKPSNQQQLGIDSHGKLNVAGASLMKKRKNNENVLPQKYRRKDGIYEDPLPVKPKKCSNKETQTENSGKDTTAATSSESVLQMLTGDVPTSEYWEILAEKRRNALEKALDENQTLHQENTELKKEISLLTEETKMLDDMVKEAKQLAELVQDAMGT